MTEGINLKLYLKYKNTKYQNESFAKNMQIKILTFFILPYVFMNSIVYGMENSIKIVNNNKTYPITISELKENLKYNKIHKESSCKIEYANDLINGKLIFRSGFPAVPYDINTITWKENPYQNAPWQLNLEYLAPVSILNACYEQTRNKAYHIRAKEFILRYSKLHSSLDEKTSKYSWSDHATATRTLNILDTISHEIRQVDYNVSFIQASFDHIGLNTKFMMDDDNHHVHNHSLMMDRALIILSNVYKSENELSDAIGGVGSKRAMDMVIKIIDETGLVNEHSIEYQFYDYNIFKSIFILLNENEISKEALARFKKMPNILEMLVKPDLSFPMWGDSRKRYLTKKLVEDFDDNQRLNAILDSSLELNSTVSFINNIGVIRDKKNDFYMAFFANYHNRIHKHHDDLSFVLQFDKVDILTDAGIPGYGSKLYPLMKSSFFHNTISVNGENYSIGRKGQYAKIVDYKRYKSYEMIKGEHNFYKGKIVERALYYIKPNMIFIIDKVKGKDVNKIQQVFNIGENANLLNEKNGKLSFKFDKQLSILIQQHNLVDQKIFYGDKTRGFISKAYRKKTPIYQLEFETELQEFMTSILIKSSKVAHPIEEVKVVNGEIIYFQDGKWQHLNQ